MLGGLIIIMNKKDDIRYFEKYLHTLKSLETNDLTGKSIIYGITPHIPWHQAYYRILSYLKILKRWDNDIYIVIADMLTDTQDKNELEIKTNYYKNIFNNHGFKTLVLSEYSKSEKYTKLFWKYIDKFILTDTIKTVPERIDPYNIFSVLHPIAECLDCRYFEADIMLGFANQLPIFELASKVFGNGKYILIDIPKDILGNDLADSTSKTRLSMHETLKSLSQKIIGARDVKIIEEYLQDILCTHDVSKIMQKKDLHAISKLIYSKIKRDEMGILSEYKSWINYEHIRSY